jgi:hypothetical protein
MIKLSLIDLNLPNSASLPPTIRVDVTEETPHFTRLDVGLTTSFLTGGDGGGGGGGGNGGVVVVGGGGGGGGGGKGAAVVVGGGGGRAGWQSSGLGSVGGHSGGQQT